MKLARIGFAVAALVAVSSPAFADGMFSKLPIVGGAAYCALYAGDGTTCVANVPAGPTTLTGNERIPADTKLPNGQSPQTVLLNSSLLANGYGGTTIATTTGTTAAVVTADGISNYIYAGSSTATYTSFKLPPNPAQNQKFCLTNAGTGVLTLTAVAVGTSGQSIVGTAPTSLPVATAVGTAGTVTLSSNCWLYNVSNTSWYRVL
jgi:hypothetical protein